MPLLKIILRRKDEIKYRGKSGSKYSQGERVKALAEFDRILRLIVKVMSILEEGIARKARMFGFKRQMRRCKKGGRQWGMFGQS